ncbi:ASCH/PUA domain-containing protein [Burkholderia gladioli]|uniref:ASCH/PUA domain-containing protein n=1 Tax=Burkholderia gladioli TaxID=28095 RepID=UPI003AFA5584
MTNNITAALTDDEREKLIDIVDRLIRNPDAVTAKDCIIGNDVRTVQWIAEHTRALLTSPRAASVPTGWNLLPSKLTEDMHAAAVRVIARCHGNDDWPPAVLQAFIDAAPAAPAAPVAEGAPDQSTELARITRMFMAACTDLGLINEALGLDPDDGGAEPILDAIQKLKDERDQWADAGYAAQAVAADGAQAWHHELKTDPDVFAAVLAGDKTHEIRYNDRGFKVGDTLRLRETRYSGESMKCQPDDYPLEYTGREVTRVISHVLDGYGLMPGWVVLSFASERAAVSPATAEERVALSGECFIVIGYGESDIPEAKIVERREDLLDAVLGMIYTHASEAPDDVRAEYAESLSDNDEWAADQWSVDFEIGGIVIWRVGLHPVTMRRERAAFAWTPLVDALMLECEKFWWNDGPDGKSADAMNAAKDAVLDAFNRASQATAPAEAREPSAWVTPEGDRSITQSQKQGMLRDGGAGASSVQPFSIACYAGAVPADAGEAVGVADSMPGANGFTMACFEAAKVPIGTKLYAAAQGAQGGKGGEA